MPFNDHILCRCLIHRLCLMIVRVRLRASESDDLFNYASGFDNIKLIRPCIVIVEFWYVRQV